MGRAQAGADHERAGGGGSSSGKPTRKPRGESRRLTKLSALTADTVAFSMICCSEGSPSGGSLAVGPVCLLRFLARRQ